MNYKSFFIVFIFLLATSCEKKKYCRYIRLDLRSEYLLRHPIKDRIYFRLNYNYSNPKNVFWDLENRKKLDSLIIIEGYKIDSTSFTQEGMYGLSFIIEGNCQYCDYYKSIYQNNLCDNYEE